MKYIYLFLFIAFLGYGCEKSNMDSIIENEFSFSPEEITVVDNLIVIYIDGMEVVQAKGSCYVSRDGEYFAIVSDNVKNVECKANGDIGSIRINFLVGGPIFSGRFRKIGQNVGDISLTQLAIPKVGGPLVLENAYGCPDFSDVGTIEFTETDTTIVGKLEEEFFIRPGAAFCEFTENIGKVIVEFHLKKIKC